MTDYDEELRVLANKYLDDLNFGYTSVTCGCRDIARIFGKPWEWVLTEWESVLSDVEDERRVSE